MFDALIARILAWDLCGDPRLERRLPLVFLDTAAVSLAALNEPLLVELQRQRLRTDPGSVRLPGMVCGLSPTVAASVLASAACWVPTDACWRRPPPWDYAVWSAACSRRWHRAAA